MWNHGKMCLYHVPGIFLVILGRGPRAFQIDKISAANPLIGKFVSAVRPEFFYKLIYGNFYSVNWSFSELFFFIFRAFFFIISPEKTVKLVIGKPTVCIKSLDISSFS